MAAEKKSSKSAHLVAHHFDAVGFVQVKLQGQVNHRIPMRKMVIVDVSGSMGDYAPQLVKNVFPSILSSAEEIDLILFSDSQRHYVTNACDLKKIQISQGSTHMSNVPNMVVNLIAKHQMVQIVIVTDGDVSDRDAVFKNAAQLLKTIPPSAVVQVLPIRFINSSHANPDTKAVMAVGMMATDKVEPQDVHAQNSMKTIGALAETFFQSTCPSATLQALVPCLCRFPGDVPQTKLPIKNNDQFMVYFQGRSLTELGLTMLDGEEVIPLTLQQTEIESEGNIRDYLALLINRARIHAVMDVNSQPMFDLVDKLSAYLALREEVSSGGQAVKPSTRLRLQQIKRRIDRSSKSLLFGIAQLKNKDAVGAFNSQQMASFLRQDDTSHASKALAKRQAKVYEGKEMDFESVVKKELKGFVANLVQHLDLFDHPDLTASFYSTETLGDMCKALGSLHADDIQGLTMEDMLLLMGGVGLPITAAVRTLVDPWIFRVDEVHMDCFLSQPDWGAARIQSKGVVLTTPGTKRPITGVVPLALTPEDETLAKFYHQHLPSLSRMQSSVAMMGMISDLPFADVALQGSTLLSMAEHITPATCTSREFHLLKKLMETLRQRIRNSKYFDDLRANLAPEYFTGDNDITGVLKPLLIWLENPSLKLIPELIRLETRWRVKSRAKMLTLDGDAVLGDWLDLKSTHSQPLQPFFVPEPAEVKCYESVEVDQVLAHVKTWLMWNPLALFVLYELDRASTVEAFHASPSHTVSDLWLAYLAVETFHCPKIVNTDTRTLTSPLLTTSADIVAYCQSIVRNYFTEEYKSAVALKTKQEKDAVRVQHLTELSTVEDVPKFLELLKSHFTPRDSDVLSTLMNPQCVKNLEKVWLFTVGKYPQSSHAVWNDGNTLRLTPKEMMQMRALFEATPRGQRMWTAFMEVRKSSCSHKYRDANPNRHGYSNECPSFWALGFETPDVMREAYSDRQWAEYVQLCRSNGLQKTYL